MKNLLQAFDLHRPYVESEFEHAVWDDTTGDPTEALEKALGEIYRESRGESLPLTRARAFAYLLDHTRMQINPHTPFALKFDTGVDFGGFASVDLFYRTMYREHRKARLAELFPKDYDRMRRADEAGMGFVYTDFWHTVPNWNLLIEQGFVGILGMARDSRARLEKENAPTERLEYLDAVILCHEAILRFLDRAWRYSLSFDMPAFSACLKGLCEHAPSTLYEVMQFSVLYVYFEEIGVERARTLGDIDRLYLPYFQADLALGAYSRGELEGLFRYFFIHWTATKRFAQEPFTIGGVDAGGGDRSNELTGRILEIYDEMNIYDPKIHMRYGKATPRHLLKKVLDMIRRGNSSICLMNDEAVYRGYERIGIPREDAQHYVVLGCYEPIIMGMEEGEIAPTRLNMAKCLELLIGGGRDLRTGELIGKPTETPFADFEAFFAAFLEQLDYFTEFAVDFVQRQGEHSIEINPSMLYSASFAECLESGLDVHQYPLKYNNLSIKLIGLATVVDSLLAVKKLVFDEKRIDMETLRQILQKNWVGYEDLREDVLADREKYGNGRELPDRLTCRITEHLGKRYCGRRLRRGGVLRLGLDSVDHCIKLGKKLAATPDGRTEGATFSRNLVCSAGMDRGGITAHISSLLKLRSEDFVDATVLDFILHPSAVQGKKGLEDFTSLIEIFFSMGGFAAQGNIINGEMLRAALEDPQKYANLQIRVCGWNEYFVKLSREKQEMFLAQCEVRR